MYRIWKSDLLSRQDWLAHGTATLAFGSTRYPNPGEPDATAENRRKFLRVLGLDPSRLVVSGNVHGKNVEIVEDHPLTPPCRRRGDVEKKDEIDRVADCDGLVTSSISIAIATKTADCLPIFIADPTTRTVAIVHAGWKGVAAGIAVEAVRAFVERGSLPRDLVVAIGPSIGPCHYEIGAPRRGEMLARTPSVATKDFASIGMPHLGGGRPGDHEEKFLVDLRAIVVRQLVASGIVASNVDASAPCTACEPERFASYHLSRDLSVGLLSAIGVRPAKELSPSV